jgi:hypothetical protein
MAQVGAHPGRADGAAHEARQLRCDALRIGDHVGKLDAGRAQAMRIDDFKQAFVLGAPDVRDCAPAFVAGHAVVAHRRSDHFRGVAQAGDDVGRRFEELQPRFERVAEARVLPCGRRFGSERAHAVGERRRALEDQRAARSAEPRAETRRLHDLVVDLHDGALFVVALGVAFVGRDQIAPDAHARFVQHPCDGAGAGAAGAGDDDHG